MTTTLFACNPKQNNQETVNKKINIDYNTNLPELMFLIKRINLGKVKRDTIVEGRYSFKNSGMKPLIIEFVNPDCTCTGFYLEKKILQPGDTSYLILKMSTKNKEGDTQVNATISANTQTHLYKISLLARVD